MDYSAKGNMTSPLVVAQWNESIESAYLTMKRNKIRHLPVVDLTGSIVGIISDRDLHKGMLPDMRDYTSFQTPHADFDPTLRVQELMSWPIRTIDEDATIRDIALGMITEKISAYLITKRDSVTGIITHEDLLKILVRILEGVQADVLIPGTRLSFGTSLRNVVDSLVTGAGNQ